VEDSSLRQWWWLTRMVFKVRNAALSPRDVKNEDRSDYVHENKGQDDKMSGDLHGFYTKMHQLHGHRQESVGLLGRKCRY
jgi:hypothetical protein